MKRSIITALIVGSIASIWLLSGCGNPTGGGGGGGSNNDNNNEPYTGPITRIFYTNKTDGLITFYPETQTCEANIVFPGASGIAGVVLSPDKKMLYATECNGGATNKIFSYGIDTGAVNSIMIETAVYDRFGYFSYICISPDGERVFVPSYGNNYTGVFSFKTTPFTLEVFATTEIVSKFVSLAVSAKNDYAYLSSQKSSIFQGTILKYDIATQSFIDHVNLSAAIYPYLIKFDNTGTLAYVVDGNASVGYVRTLYLSSFTFASGSIAVGARAWDMGISSNGKAYVTNSNDDTVSVINISNEVVDKTIQCNVGMSVNQVIIDDYRGRAYVNGYAKPILAIIDTNTDTLITTIELPSTSNQAAAY